MVSIGYFLSCEEFGPRELVRQARQAADAGFERLWISDHYHPWPYLEQVRSYVDAGFDEVYVAQTGLRQEEFFQFWRDKVAPQLPR